MRWMGITAALVLLALAAASPAAARTYLPDCASTLRYKPRTVSVFCADGGLQVRRIHWSSWGTRHAHGLSRHAFLNDCTPSCAEGHFRRVHVRLALRRPVACADGRRAFTRMRVTFPGQEPAHALTQRTFCPGE